MKSYQQLHSKHEIVLSSHCYQKNTKSKLDQGHSKALQYMSSYQFHTTSNTPLDFHCFCFCVSKFSTDKK